MEIFMEKTEYDIVVQFNDGKKKIILLIEDKVYSPEQPEQAKRYDETAKDLVENKKCDKCITCILCSEQYFRENAPMNKYKERIFFEELLDWFKKQPDSRMQFKQMVIENGIENARQGWEKKTDEITTRYHNYYRKIAHEMYPELEFSKKEPASGKTWIHIDHGIFPTNIHIVHKEKEGYVDLQIDKINHDEFRKWYQGKGEGKMYVQDTGKSISVRIETSKIQDTQNITEPEIFGEKIVEGLQAVERLKNWYLKWSNESIFALKL